MLLQAAFGFRTVRFLEILHFSAVERRWDTEQLENLRFVP